MTGLVRRATLLCAVSVLAASAAMAGVPSATTSVQPTGLVIKIVGHGSPPDAAGNITYTVRDASNNAVPGSVVILNFAACSDVHVCSSDVGSGMTVNCGAHTVTGVTNASGQVTMVVAGTGVGTTGPYTLSKCVAVTADGVPFSNLNGATADMNGAGGVTSADISIGYGDVVFASTNGVHRLRSDFNGDGSVTSADLSVLYGIVVGGGSPLTCTTLCP
jgi:hypothetical protein